MKTRSPVMLACNQDWTDAELRPSFRGYLISNKIDGIRAWTERRNKLSPMAGVRLMTRVPGKSIQNEHIQHKFNALPPGLDGELFIPGCTFHESSGIIRSDSDVRGKNAIFFAFDCLVPEQLRYSERLALLCTAAEALPDVHVLYQVDYLGPRDVLEEELHKFDVPFEGYIVRNGDSYYKYGRATKRESSLFKLVPNTKETGTLVNFTQRVDRSTYKLLPEVGVIHVKLANGRVAALGTGRYTRAQSRSWWENRLDLLATQPVITFAYKAEGTIGAPRQASYISGLP